MIKKTFVVLFFSFLFFPLITNAYIGPGLGAGAFSTFIGIIFSIFLGIFGILYYPIKKLFLKIKKILKK